MNKVIPWLVMGGAVLVLAVFVGGYLLTNNPTTRATIVNDHTSSSPLEPEASGTIAVVQSIGGSSVSTSTQQVIAVAQSSTSKAPQGWKMYQNTKYGFEMWYPPQLSVTSEVEASGLIRVVIGDSIMIDGAKLYGKSWQDFFKLEKPYSTLGNADISNNILTKQYTDSRASDMIQWASYVGGNSQFYYDISVMTVNTSKQSKSDYQQSVNDAKKAVTTFQTIEARAGVSQPIPPPLQVSSNWKTFKNTQFAFEISYPQEWNANEYSQEGVSLANYTSTSNQPATPMAVTIQYYKNDNPQSLALSDYIATKYAIEKSLFAKAISVQNITIGGLPAIKYIWQGDYGGSGSARLINTKTYTYYVSRGKDIMYISSILPLGVGDDSIATVLSTVKFM